MSTLLEVLDKLDAAVKDEVLHDEDTCTHGPDCPSYIVETKRDEAIDKLGGIGVRLVPALGREFQAARNRMAANADYIKRSKDEGVTHGNDELYAKSIMVWVKDMDKILNVLRGELGAEE